MIFYTKVNTFRIKLKQDMALVSVLGKPNIHAYDSYFKKYYICYCLFIKCVNLQNAKAN